MVFDTDISDGVAKMRAATLLGDIGRLYQRTKTPLKYVQTNSKFGNVVSILASDTKEYFSKSAIDKVLVDKILLRLSGGKEEIKVAMAQYLSKYLFEKYEDEANFAASQCGFPVSTYMKPE